MIPCYTGDELYGYIAIQLPPHQNEYRVAFIEGGLDNFSSSEGSEARSFSIPIEKKRISVALSNHDLMTSGAKPEMIVNKIRGFQDDYRLSTREGIMSLASLVGAPQLAMLSAIPEHAEVRFDAFHDPNKDHIVIVAEWRAFDVQKGDEEPVFEMDSFHPI